MDLSRLPDLRRTHVHFHIFSAMSRLSNAIRKAFERLEPNRGGANARGAAGHPLPALNQVILPPPQGPPDPPGHNHPHLHPGPEFNPQFGINNAFGGADLEYHRHVLSQFDPNTMSVIEKAIEHRTFNGELVKEEVSRRVLCEGCFVSPREVEGICDQDGRLALKIFRCAMPECTKSLCRSHAILHEGSFYCAEHLKMVLFHHDTWKEYDEKRSRTNSEREV